MKVESDVEDQSFRVAMVAACPFPSPRGSQVLIREMAQALARRGHAVHVVTYPYGESLLPLRGIFIHRIRPLPMITTDPGIGWRRVILDVFLALRLYAVVRREQIQVIHAHNYEGPLISYVIRRLTGVPVVYHSHNALSDELGYYFKAGWRRSMARWVGRMLDRQIPRRADFSIALTRQLADFLRARGVSVNRLALVPPGVPPATTIKSGSRTDPFAGRFVVMYTGNLDPYQGLDVLLNGFAAFQQDLPRALLVIVTHEVNWSHHASAALKALVQAGRARVLVVPVFSAVRRLLARADVLVCPRSSWSGFPIKLLNYLAAGRPVVVAEGSAKGVTDEQTGLIFRDGDAHGLAAALHRLCEDPWLRLRLGENARIAARQADDWEDAAARIEQIYKRVCPPTASQTAPSQGAHGAMARGLIALSRGRISAASTARRG